MGAAVEAAVDVDVGLPREVDVRVDHAERERQHAEHEADDEAAEKDGRPVHFCSSGTSVRDSRSMRPGIEIISPSRTRHPRESGCDADSRAPRRA
jgi:hypothetical protein